MLAWLVAVPISFAVTAAPTYWLGLITKNDHQCDNSDDQPVQRRERTIERHRAILEVQGLDVRRARPDWLAHV